jgi:tRNA (cytidine56-2'-O)-methyltransferase
MIHVLRLGHRRARDARVTTHVALTARAFGADGITVAESDPALEKTLRDVVARFGGPFEVHTGAAWRPLVRAWKERGGLVVHLTMYGEPLSAFARKAPERDVLVVVGAEKVPGDLYDLADHNVAVGNQPHSEVAALAITLDRLTRGAWERREFDGRLRVVPNPRGKTLIDRASSESSKSRGTPGGH